MTLSDFATLSTAISGLAVTASLIYLALQTHQNVRHTKALIQQGRAERVANLALTAANADFTSAVIVGNGGTPSPEGVKRLQYQFLCTTLVLGWEDTFGQHEAGLLSEDQFGSFRAGLSFFFLQSGFRRFWDEWKAARPNIQTNFKAWVDDVASETQVVAMDAILGTFDSKS